MALISFRCVRASSSRSLLLINPRRGSSPRSAGLTATSRGGHRSPSNERKTTYTLKNATIAIIAGLATTTAVAGTAGSAVAAEKSPQADAASSKVVATGGLSGDAGGRSVGGASLRIQGGCSPQGPAYLRGRGGHHPCYAYSNGRGDFCLWYLTNYTQSRGGVGSNDSNLVNNYFVTSGSGQGSSLTNNAESDYNYDSYYTAKVTTSPNYYGYVGSVRPRTGGNFNSTYTNNVESIYWS